MRINRIHLENYRIHEKLDVEFDKGINLLLGENGRGKSSILEAIGYALFDSELRGGNQREAIKYGKKSAKIEIEFTGIDGEEYIVTRKIPGSTAIYKKDNPELQLTGKEERIRELCGIKGDLKGIYDNVIVAKQNEFISSFKEKDTEREKIFNRVFNTDIYKKIYEGYSREAEKKYDTQIAIESKSISSISEIMEDPQELKEKITFEREKAEEFNKRVALLNEEKKQIREQLTFINEKTLEIEKLNGRLKTLEENIKNKSSESERVKTLLEESTIAEKIAKENREDHEKYITLSKELSKKREEKKKLEILKEKQSSREKETVKLEKDKSDSEGEITLLESKIENFKNNMEEKYTTLGNLNREIEEKNSKIEEYKKELEKIVPLIDEATSYENLIESGNKTLSAFKVTITEKENDLKSEVERKEKLLKENIPEKLEEIEKNEKIKTELDNEITRNILLGKDNEEAFKKLKSSYCPYLNEECRNLAGRDIDSFFIDRREKYKKIILEKKAEVVEIEEKLKDKNELLEKKGVLSNLLKRIEQKEQELEKDRLRLEKGEQNLKTKELEYENWKLKNNIVNREQLNASVVSLKTKIENQDIQKSEIEKGELLTGIKYFNSEIKKIENKLEEKHKNIIELCEKLEYLKKNIEENAVTLVPLNDVTLAVEETEGELKELEKNNELYLTNYKKALEREKLSIELQELAEAIKKSSENFEDSKKELEKSKKDIENLDRELLEKEEATLNSETAEIREQLGGTNISIANLEKRLADVEKYEGILKEKRKLIERLKMKLELTKIFRERIKSMGKEVSKNMLKEIEILATENFRKITGRGEKIVWSNEDKDKYLVYLSDDKGDLKFEQLSGGEQVAVAISIRGAMSELFTESRFSIFDEPTNNLDSERRRSLADSIGEILKNLEQSIIVTHDDTFREMAQKVIEL